MRKGCIGWGWVSPGLVISILIGCSADRGPEPGTLDDPGRLDDGTGNAPLDPCLDPTQTDCPCADEGARLGCGEVQELRGDYAICSMGSRSCLGGVWSECVGERLVEADADPTATAGGLRLQALSAGVDCLNLCDPHCIKVVDSPTGLGVDDDLQSEPIGLTLPELGSGGNCANILVSPASATINVTAIAANGAITTSPVNASATFSALCSSGVSIQPSWSMDAYDRAVIDSNGTVTPFSGIGSPIVVTATSAQDTTTALVDVRVHIETVTGSPPAAALTAYSTAALPPTVLTADAGKTLYPYKNTVFPLDLKAPLVQWETGGSAATETRVALRFPASSASPTFWYSRLYAAGGTAPKDGTLSTSGFAWQIPQEIWSAFDRSAAGSATGGEILIQRRYGSPSVVHEMKIPVKFATASVPGTVYYTQYRRQFINPCPATQPGCNYNSATFYTSPGQICEVGSGTHPSTATYPATVRAIDLSQKSAPNLDPFSGGTKCPVCHSVSANGNVFVAGNQSWVQTGTPPQTLPGKSINGISLTAAGAPTFGGIGTAIAPTYTGLSDTGAANTAGDPYNNQERTGENSRGFAYGAITPDGSMVLQGANFWGNTQDNPGSATQNATLTGLTGGAKPYFFARTDLPGVGVQFATTDALTGYSAATPFDGILSGSSGSLTVDGYTLTGVDQSVLVKNEPTSARNGVYTLSQVSPWRLVRRYDADTSNELAQYTEVRVSDGNTNRGRVFYVSSATPATLNTSNIQFSERSRPVSFTSAPFEVDYATTAVLAANTLVEAAPATLTVNTAAGAFNVDGAGSGIIVGKRILVKDETTQKKNGIYSVSVVGTSSTPWRLTRTTDVLTPLAEITVKGGSVNGSKTYYISSPASGTINTTSAPNTATAYKLTLLPSMMVPVISPDGSRIAYVNGDADTTPGLADTGWRKGLSLLNFEQDLMQVSRKSRLVNNWPSGAPIKWPFFESDSKSLIYVETETGEYCSAADADRANGAIDTNVERACMDASYGNMSPTTRGYWKGKLFSVDSSSATPSSTRAELSKLNDGDDDGGADDAANADHVYQPTVLPQARGGYRWAIFTTTRAYGNQLNQVSGGTATHFTCAASTLWMSAIDDTVATASDRSHPAFLLPGQNLAAITSATPHYINERGYLVPTPCKTSGLSCTSNDECCGGGGSAPTAACRAPTTWTPASGPPAKTCSAVAGTCSNAGQSCNTPSDCCNNAACVNFLCAAPPSYEVATFEREYTAECPDSYQPVWQLLSYYLTTESDSRLEFGVQTASLLADLDAAPLIDVGASTATVVSPATPDFQDVGKALNDADSNNRKYLRLIVTFMPSTDGQTAPVLHDWELRYTCEANQ